MNSHDLDASLKKALGSLSSEERESRDSWGNGFYWATLPDAEKLPEAAALLADHHARLCMISALTRSVYTDPVVFLDYHFDVHGFIVTLLVPVGKKESSAEVPTITPKFRNADWHEREISELFGVHFRGNVNPNRLFLDPTIDAGILRDIVPLTVMMNGTCSKDLWEHVMQANESSAKE